MNKEDRRNKAVMVEEDDSKFPEGIRVLVVDDDQTCLLWIENLLQTCRFKATTTLFPREALNMLRQDKNKYDLVITDVQMPDINGFQLLETIGLEMDLPVIMMSIYNSKKFVKKGVKHGAVDYLLKPVRLEEIQNIWQHVLRRWKGKGKEKNIENADKSSPGAANAAVADAGDTSSKRRRVPNDDDPDYEDEDSGRENDEQSSHKRPRVVWTPELHRKFVAAVNHLGVDKAVPKKILDIMDVESLTRENVASHLQKYRMYLKKISNGNGQQNMVGRSAMDAMSFRGGRYPNSLLSGYPPSLSGIFSGRLSSGEGMSFGSVSSFDLIQSGQNLRNSISTQAKLQPHGLPSFPNTGSLQGIGHSADFTQGAMGFGVSDNFVDPKAMLINGSNSNSLMLSGPSQFTQTSQSLALGAFRPGSSSGGFVEQNETPESWKALVQNHESSFQLGGIQQQLIAPLRDASSDLNSVFDSLNPLMLPNGGVAMGTLSMEQNSLGTNGDSFIGHVTQTITKPSEGFIAQDDLIPDNIESMDDIVNSLTRTDNNGSASLFIDGEFNFDAYSPAAGL